jgi:predicted transcriptional regulator
MNEKFRTVAEVAEMLGVSRDTVRRLFADEPGVIDLGRRPSRADAEPGGSANKETK